MADTSPRALVPVTETPDDPVQATASCNDLFDDYAENGEHAEYQSFEKLIQRPLFTLGTALSPSRWLGPYSMDNVWDFVEDAVNGAGGFADGSYLCPHAREFDPTTKKLDDKFWGRMLTAHYDNFVKPIAETPWNYIVQMRDMIERKPNEDLREDVSAKLIDFWTNADGRGTEMTDFMELPARQARLFGTGWIVVDRPATPLANAAVAEGSQVYAYSVPSRHVVHWTFDDDFRLTGVVIKEPWAEVVKGGEPAPYDVRVWTSDGWAVYRPPDAKLHKPDGSWTVVDAGRNELGEVPVVQMFDEDPGPGKGFGATIIPTVCRVGLTCFNQLSEIREIQRNTGFPFLAVPMRDASKAKELTIGTENILGYDGTSGGPPTWVTQALTEAAAIREDMEKKKESAYGMAHMAAIMGWVQTSSGFHAETEFDKTNRRIGKFAASCESAENKIARLVLKYHAKGINDKQARDLVSVTYPRDFGLRDIDAVVARCEKRLNMVLGEKDAVEAIYEMYSALYPRLDKKELRKRAEQAAKARYEATGGAQPAAVSPAPPQPRLPAVASLSSRLQGALVRRKQPVAEVGGGGIETRKPAPEKAEA